MSTQPTPDYFNDLKEWSQRKLDILERYLDGATKILGSIQESYYVDGFAGRGEYGTQGGNPIPGSPVRAAELALAYEQAQKPYRFSCINIEAEHDYFLDLQLATTRFGTLVTNIEGEFADNVDTVLSLVGSQPVICFLDPFGISGMDWSAVQKMIRRQGITDLWLRFDASAVLRHAGWYVRFPAREAVNHFSILTKTYGISNPEHLYLQLTSGATPQDRKEAALQLYMSRLRLELRNAKQRGYVASYRIGSLDEDTKYYLIFACADPKGFILASDVVYAVEEEYQRDVERHKQLGGLVQGSLFDAAAPSVNDIFNTKVDKVVDALRIVGQGKTLSRRELHAKVLEDQGWFGIIKAPHVTAAINKLVHTGSILSLTGNVSNDKTEFTFRA